MFAKQTIMYRVDLLIGDRNRMGLVFSLPSSSEPQLILYMVLGRPF